jgi:hypothetical protein
MRREPLLLARCVGFVLLSGCGSDPLDGAWKTSIIASGVTLENTWVSSESSTPSAGRLTTSGTIDCASNLRCVGGGVVLECGQLQGDPTVVCDYELSDHNDKLELFRCTDDPGHRAFHTRAE